MPPRRRRAPTRGVFPCRAAYGGAAASLRRPGSGGGGGVCAASAEAKLKAEQKAREQYTEKGRTQRKLLNQYVEDSRELENRLTSLLRYQSYLDSVIAPGSNDNDFEDIGEVLSRYQTLQTANRDLQQHQAEGETNYDTERNNNAHLLEKAQNDILVNNSIIHEKQKANENLKKETSDLGARIETSETLKRSTKTE